MNSLTILGWDKKPKTLYRYIKEGDIFAFQIKIDLFGFGRILANNPLGVSAEIFDIFQPNPDDLFKNYDYDKLSILFITILDAHSLFQAKLDTEWRIITKEKAISEIKQFPWKDEFPHHHYHILELLIKCKPELFTFPLLNFMGFEKFISDTLSKSKK